MYIDEWNGWVWRCPSCDKKGRKATKEEIKEHESSC